MENESEKSSDDSPHLATHSATVESPKPGVQISGSNLTFAYPWPFGLWEITELKVLHIVTMTTMTSDNFVRTKWNINTHTLQVTYQGS